MLNIFRGDLGGGEEILSVFSSGVVCGVISTKKNLQ